MPSDYDDIFDDEPFDFVDPPRRPDAVTVLSRVLKSLLAVAAVTSLVLAGVALHRIDGFIGEVRSTGHATQQKAAHTRALQKQSEPASACLREAMAAGIPIAKSFSDTLEKARPKVPAADRGVFELFVELSHNVEAPLAEYVKLTKARYEGISCPIPHPKSTGPGQRRTR